MSSPEGVGWRWAGLLCIAAVLRRPRLQVSGTRAGLGRPGSVSATQAPLRPGWSRRVLAGHASTTVADHGAEPVSDSWEGFVGSEGAPPSDGPFPAWDECNVNDRRQLDSYAACALPTATVRCPGDAVTTG